MPEAETGFTTDHQGKPSSMRLISIVCVVVASLIALALTLAIYKGQGEHLEIGLYLSLLFLLAGTAPKSLQSYVERRFPIGSVAQ